MPKKTRNNKQTKERGGANDTMKEVAPTNTANILYDASATFGRIMAYFKLAGGIIVGVILMLVGIYLIRKKPTLTSQVQAQVTAVKCQDASNQCNATVQFVGADGKQYTSQLVGTYSVGQKIMLNYDPTNPSSTSSGNTMSDKTAGIIFLVFGILITLASGIWFYFVQKYKTVAAVSGVLDATGAVGNAFNYEFNQ
jgi:hypothetical protein